MTNYSDLDSNVLGALEFGQLQGPYSVKLGFSLGSAGIGYLHSLSLEEVHGKIEKMCESKRVHTKALEYCLNKLKSSYERYLKQYLKVSAQDSGKEKETSSLKIPLLSLKNFVQDLYGEIHKKEDLEIFFGKDHLFSTSDFKINNNGHLIHLHKEGGNKEVSEGIADQYFSLES